MNKPKREDYATAADFNFWMCAWQHDEIERLLDELKESRRVISVFVAEGSPHLTRIDAALGAADQPAAATEPVWKWGDSVGINDHIEFCADCHYSRQWISEHGHGESCPHRTADNSADAP